MKYRLVSLFSIMFGTFLLILVAAARFAFYVSTISFQTNGANPIASVQIQAGDTLELPSPTRVGYTFGGWFLDPEFQRSANVLVLSNQNKTLYAYWIANLYTLSFDSNGGSDVEAIIQTFDSALTAPTQPTLPGYDFAGWFLDDTTFNEPFFFETMPLSTTVYAKWTPTIYNITYVINGGVLAEGTTLSYTVEDDLVVFNDPIREGHTFDGWYDNNAFDGDVYVAINPNRMADLTLYAKWTVNQYTIIFDANGGSSVAPIIQDYGTVITAPGEPTKQGYTFLGWLNNGEVFTFTTMPVDGAYLVAAWEINSYNVTFDVNGGDPLTNGTESFDYDSTITLATPSRAGYQFTGWSDGNTTWETGDRMPDSNLSLTAQWTLINYPITYVMDFGFNDNANPSSYTILDATITLIDPTKEGHTFLGWFTDAGFNNSITSIPQGSTGAFNIYAKWLINTYTVTLDVAEGDPLTQTSFTYTFASTLSLPTPTRLGFNFTGWTSDNVTYGTGNLMPAKDLDLVAQWAVKTYDVKYYYIESDITSGKLPVATIPYTLGETIIEEELTRNGYEFVQWIDASTGLPFEFGIVMTDISEPYLLYGEWELIIYNINYQLIDEDIDSGDESEVTNPEDNPSTFTVEDPITPLVAPTRSGYTFLGWKSDTVTVSTVGGSGTFTNITLTAQWQLIRYDITYNENGGINNFNNPRNFNVEETYQLLPAVRNGYTFDGWQNQNGVIMTEIPLGTSGSLTLTAQWTINKHTLRYRTLTGQSYTTVNNKEFGSPLGMSDPTRLGYTFTGWQDDASGAYYSTTDTMPDKNLDLTGTWDINTYSISYDLDNGTTAATPFTYNYTVIDAISIASPTRTGWVFVGWDKDNNGTADHTPSAGTTTISAGTYAEDLNFKAVWTQNIYTMTYDSSGGNDISDKTFTFSQQLDSTYFPTPVKTGETFIGWFDDQGRRWAVGIAYLNVGPNNNLNLTARWATFPRSITYDAANGEDTYTTTVYPGANVYIGFTPFKEGHTFIGWMDLDDGTYYTKDSIMPDKDLTLTAQWQPN